MKTVKVTYANGDTITTCINGTDESVLEYFAIGKVFNIGSVEDNLQAVKKCEIIHTLSDYYQLAYNAHRNTSFSPEKRAADCIKSHSDELNSDLVDMPENVRERYKENYIKKFTAWLAAKSRCISSMITGPANFPVRRAEKANQSERNRCDEFIAWREYALNNIKKNADRAARPAGSFKENVTVKFDGGEVIVNYELDRIQIKHDEKPGPGLLNTIKSQSFRYSPSQVLWQRQLTDNGKRAVCRVTGVNYELLKSL